MLVPGSSGRYPLFDPGPFDGKGIYLRLDKSVQLGKIKDGRLLAGDRNLFDTGPDTVWGDDVPDVKAPRYANHANRP